ncbi:hypothetical protein like AT5G25360 [Hibiscus trionum]|uniref:Gag1-like clamp domain-containing protein n=1 Tax=Hibiscus trionum TaxID=183268 RepID=A0A9W7HQ45_HIBTR|nr:hypothetical protein like AT5G25360 [Hibiscus trionum]
MGGCLGCCKRPIFNPLANESSKGLKSQGQSQGSISSISASNQTLDPNGSAASAIGPSEFVNHGLLLWNQTRQHWVGNKKSENQPRQVREPKLNWNATYESLLGSNKPFPQPIPLSEMINFLVDVWEQEGLYD